MEDKYSISALRKRGVAIATELKLPLLAEACKSRDDSDLVEILRKQQPEEVKKFLQEFYGRFENESEPYFPNGDDLAEYTEKILRIRWFEPSRNYTNEELQPYVNGIMRSFKLKNKKAEITKDINAARKANWDAIWGATWGPAKSAAWDAARSAARGAARGPAWGAAWRGAAWDADLDAAGGAAYILVQDLPELKKQYPENPFEKLIDIYELGLWPAGIKEDRFLIWHPVVKKAV